ncbi:serine protease 53-like [Schistocerca piceifrons]|uniref:serine protease 53-like n=1 Tax=Schistocerca piceifrons TaxID=274613 RepID=UPI001F5EFEED|nr:serine protease 53-like [Schistocerca piceifrons]
MSGLEGEAPDYERRPPSQLFVVLGAATANWDPDAPGAVINKVSRVLVDDAYSSVYAAYEHSLAVVELEVPLALTDSVRPICVDSGAQPQHGDISYMVAPDSNKNLTLKLQRLKHTSRENCIGDSIYARVPEHKFCADSSDEPVCQHARGSGLVWRAADGRWLLEGVASVNTAHRDWDQPGRCVAGQHVFSDVDSQLPLLRRLLLSSCFSGRPSTAPWHAQLYLRTKERRGHEYACAAALLTHRYLLTDGSCFKGRTANNSTDASGFVVALGKKVKSLQARETGSQILKVSRVVLQEGGRGLAIVELEVPAVLGDSVAAVCLNTATQRPLADGVPAVVATFSPTENSALKLLYVNVVDSDKCLVEKPDFKTFLSDAKFCATDKKAAVCQGNEGSAMLTRAPDRGAWWTLRGVLAPTPQPPSSDDACPKGNAIFTSVDHSLRWILDTLQRLSVPRSLLKPEGVRGCWSGHAGNIPWHALIYRQLERPEWFDLQCAGTIVSRRHVVTDAACFWDETSRTMRDVSTLRVTAGKKTRDFDAEEADVQIRKISRVLLQPGYQRETGSGPAVAVALLERPLELSGAVHSVCIDESAGSPLKDGQTGLVATLGLPRYSELKILNMNVLKKNECLAELSASSCWTMASDNFCAIDRKVSEGLCSGNVGAGLVVRGPGGAWLLKGAASFRQLCGPNHHCSKATVFFTDVDDSRDWLWKTVQASTSYHVA